VRDPSGDWRALGPGRVTLYRVDQESETVHAGPLTLDA